jgi:hypothetical protein
VFSLRVDAAGYEDRHGRGQQPRRPGAATAVIKSTEVMIAKG